MSNKVLQIEKNIGKSYLPSPYPNFRLILKKGAMKQIMSVKGWKNLSQAAESLGFTRQYMSMMEKTKVSVSAEFITRMAACLGSLQENWHVHYEIVPWGIIDENHPTWNMQKYDGKMPYRRYSISAEGRKKDYTVEKKNT